MKTPIFSGTLGAAIALARWRTPTSKLPGTIIRGGSDVDTHH